jgi:hypothetical protein
MIKQDPNRKKRVSKMMLDSIILEELAKEDSKGITKVERIIERLVGQALKGDVVATKLVLEYGYGKPRTQTEPVESFKMPTLTIKLEQ